MNSELLSSATRSKLSALRRTLYAHLLGGGLALALVALVASVFLTLAVDRGLDLTRAQRVLILAACLAGIGYVLWRFVLRPLRVKMNQQELALVLEKHFPELNDRLISAIQFVEMDAKQVGASEELIAKVADQANALAAGLNASSPVQARRTWKRAGVAAAAVAVLLGFSAWQQELMGLWFQRNVLLADVAWPRQTYLSVEGGPNFKVVRGGNLSVKVRASSEHVVPAEVTFQMQFPGLGRVSENAGAAQQGGNVFIKTFENVTDGFEFRVSGNDDQTGWCKVVVVDPPELVELSGQKFFPDYMSREPAEITPEHGVITVPPGGRLKLAGRANKDLSAAVIRLDGEVKAVLNCVDCTDPADPDGPKKHRGVEGLLLIPEKVSRTSMPLEFDLTDTEGVNNPRGAAYYLRVEPDRPPSVALDRKGVRGDITANAIIPLLISCRDDYGVSELAVHARCEGEALAGSQPATAPASAPVAASRPASRAAGESVESVGGVPKDQKEFKLEHNYDIIKMRLRVGQILKVRAVGKDTLPGTFGGPNVAESPAQSFRIVSEDELLAELVRREKEIQQEFQRTVDLQALNKNLLLGVKDQLQETPKVEADVTAKMATALRDQKQVAGQCQVVADQLQEVLDEMHYNRVGEPVDKVRLADHIIQPLRDIAKKPMNDLIVALDRASKGTDAGAMKDFAGEAAGIMEDFHKRLTGILAEMKQLESRQELARQLKNIIRMSEEIRKELDERMKKSGNLFDPASQPAP